MKRRAFISTCCASLAALGLPAFAQRAQAPRRIGVIHSGGLFNRDQWGGIAFVGAMKELGYEEGRDYIYDERRWERSEQIPALVRELLRLKVDVIVAVSPPTIAAAKSATNTVPIVMVFSANPIATGLVRSLNRPGENLTGLAWDHGFETYVKQLEIFKDTLPKLRRVALLWDTNPDSTHDIYVKYYEEGARQLGLGLISAGVQQTADIAPAFDKIRRAKAEALVILPSAQVTVPQREAIMALATKGKIPTLAGIVHREFPGALFHHAPNLSDNPRRVAAYVDRIFKGAKPGDLPIEQPMKYDLIVDLKVARSLGITVPPSVLVRAERVIE